MLGRLEQFGVGRLLEDVVELVCMGYPLSVIRGLVHSLPCSRVTQICRKTVRTWISLCRVAVRNLGVVVETQLGRALPDPPALLGEDGEEEYVFGEV